MSRLFGRNNERLNEMVAARANITSEMVNAKYNMSQLENNKIQKDDFLSMDKMVLPQNLLLNPLPVLALSYDCNSKVGSWTNMAMAICTAIPEEFFNEDGTLNFKRFNKAFKCATKTGKVPHYNSIFMDSINVRNFSLQYDENYNVIAYYVSNREVKEFANRISALDYTTINTDDIRAIQADLWFLFRAWQESSIDMVKDKSKQFAIAMDEVLGSIDVKTTVKFNDITINDYDIKTKKYSDEDIPAVNIDLGRFEDDNTEKDYINTTLTDAQEVIIGSALDGLQKAADAFVNASVVKFERYHRYAAENEELALTIYNVFRILRDYSNTSKEEKEAGLKLTAKDYAILRAVIYNDAAELEIRFEDVIKIALGVASCESVYVFTNKFDEEGIVIRDFSEEQMSKNLPLVQRLFGNIAIHELAGLYESDMIFKQFIKQELEVRHIFQDVNNGVYKMVDGKAYENKELLFDTTSELTGEVLVEDAGVFFLYDPLTEVEYVPEFTAIFSNEFYDDEEDNKEIRGNIAAEALRAAKDIPVVNITEDQTAVLIGEGEDEDTELFIVDTTIEEGQYEISKFYGINGARLAGENYIYRSNKFLLLNYNDEEMTEYVNNFTVYSK